MVQIHNWDNFTQEHNNYRYASTKYILFLKFKEHTTQINVFYQNEPMQEYHDTHISLGILVISSSIHIVVLFASVIHRVVLVASIR